jgi:hypothetical protein
MALDPRQQARIHGARPTPEASPNLARSAEAANRVFDVPRANFMLAHRSSEWQMNGDGELVPVIVQLSKSPGVQGVGRRGQFGEARAWYEEQGLTLIPHDILPADYVALYKNEQGHPVHRVAFATPENTTDGQTFWTQDSESWGKFIRLLRIRKIVKPPLPIVVKQMLDREKRDLDSLRSPGDNHHLRVRYDRDVKRISRNIGTLEVELEASFQLYGRPVSNTRSSVADLLDAALDAEGDAAALYGSPPAVEAAVGQWTKSTRPTVEALPDRLATLQSADTVAQMQAFDPRPTAQVHYADRLAQLQIPLPPTGDDDDDEAVPA